MFGIHIQGVDKGVRGAGGGGGGGAEASSPPPQFFDHGVVTFTRKMYKCTMHTIHPTTIMRHKVFECPSFESDLSTLNQCNRLLDNLEVQPTTVNNMYMRATLGKYEYH